MVKTLDLKTSEFVDLKKLNKDNYKVSKKDNYRETYACDCNTFGGGEPPCDCNR